MQEKTVGALLIALLTLGSGLVWAQTVYKSIDDNGNVTFSDTPPADSSATEQLELNVPTPQSPEEQAQSLEDMRETTDRMAADRREREKHRAEIKELNARKQAVAAVERQQNESTVDDYYTTVPGYTTRSRRYYGPQRPGYSPIPVHPIARPPLRPMPREGFSNNSQLMRPMVSGNSSLRSGGR